jgi:hypothetical protein
MFKLTASPPDDRDIIYQPPSSGFFFKRGVTLQPYVNAIEYQGNEGSCTAHAVTTACEAELVRAGVKMQLSRAFNYFKSREARNMLETEGAILRDALQSARHDGLPPESTWPYDETTENVTPSAMAASIAQQRRLVRYERLPFDGENWFDRATLCMQALSEGKPLVIGIPIGEQMYDTRGPLEFQNMAPIGPGNPGVGAHALAVVGYLGGINGPLVFANSWGEWWGDGGYGALPLPMLDTVFEAWAISNFAGYDASGRAWAIDHQDVVRDYVNLNISIAAGGNTGRQAIIDAAGTINLLRAELEEIMGWAPGVISALAQSEAGRELNWKGFER